MGEVSVGLAAVIAAVRADLIEAQRAGQGERLSFSVGKVVIELGGEIKATGGAGAGVKSGWSASTRRASGPRRRRTR